VLQGGEQVAQALGGGERHAVDCRQSFAFGTTSRGQ